MREKKLEENMVMVTPIQVEEPDIREKIARIVYDWNCQTENCPLGEARWIIADQILSLPIEGCGEVKEKCPNCDTYCIGFCPTCAGNSFISRPLTLGELLKKAPILIKIAQWANDENDKDCMEFFNCPADESWCKENNCPIDDALTFKDK